MLSRVAVRLLHHGRVEHLRDVKVHVVVTVQLHCSGDVVALRNESDLRLGFGDLSQQLRGRQHNRLRHGNVGALHSRAIGPDNDGGGQPPPFGLRGQKLAELVAVLIEQWLGAGKIVGHSQDLAADDLGMISHISVGDDQRLLDHGLRAGREKTVEAAVESRARDDGHKDGRNRGNDNEQADDLYMQP